MMKEEKFLLLAADSTHLIIKSEKLLKENGIECRIIPLPSEVKATCGLSIRMEFENKNKVEELLKSNGIELERYSVIKKGLKKHIEKLD
ncbi:MULTISPECIES: DUF3343 domain-containing protein [Fusobacterium]|jgi:hypothetical protein|uniref:DUF3343 domain-containing protein n=1 Tax=Fusobacterium varium ATCC 27725 TaxID=469618 RepID=A0ABM6U0N0_FUSVA|nr:MULTISPECIES: DUF3343 domain-containing protein [Fusobacterium]AVQ29855.1 DUF3343 domain-containing protein [Fusobacterium varium ATCC 27725]EES65148.1 hypothetical protein FVAG_02128 [Fusobacterium varium ATCC 27725]MCF0170595.1 DUF3343 domain-containing protein [Fusobacterium varium]MCF2674283.1 DUF3343 domain-containing protein [Fusobacterium varium]MCI6031419.1 DUF3343 domain-containing protein [Fusobacterium varium]